MIFDQVIVDGIGVFFVYELECFDQILNLLLVNFIWLCDIQLCEDVFIVDEISLFINIIFVVVGMLNVNGKNWFSKVVIVMVGFNVDIVKIGFLFILWGMEFGWIVFELQVVVQVGCLIDMQKYDGMQLKWNMDMDEQVYIGDFGLNVKGLLNLMQVMLINVVKIWVIFIVDEIWVSINVGLSVVWVNLVYFMVLMDMLILLEQFFLLVSIIVFSVGNQFLLIYLEINIIVYYQNGCFLNICLVKWVKGCGVLNFDCMMFYINDKKYVCFLMVLLMSVLIQYCGLYQFVIYYGKLGVVELVYLEILVYVDGI